MPDSTLPKASPQWLEVSLHWGQTLLDVQTFAPGQAVRLAPGLHLEDAFELPKPGEQRVLRAGSLRLVLRWIDAAPRPPGALAELDLGFVELLGLGLLLHAMLLIGIQLTPTTDELPSERLFSNPADIVKVLVRPPKPPNKFPQLPVFSSAKPKGAAGKFGITRALRAQADPSRRGSPVVDARRRERDRSRVLATGLLGALADNSRAASNVFGPGGIGNGLNTLLGGLRPGAGMNSASGIGGLASRGTGPGGGGTVEGIGGLGTRPGRGGGGGPDLGLGGSGKEPLRIHQGKRSVGVALDKSVIAGVIRRHWSEIKYCYEAQLNRDPHLAGKVAIAFTIGGAGAVTEARVSESSLDEVSGGSRVEDCMVEHIGRWRFPEPRGGGQVFVTYPWVFKAAGAEE